MYANCVKYGNDLLWLSRVPENMNLSKALLSKSDVDWIDLANGYKMFGTTSSYGNINQRWILIYSEQAYIREIATLDRNIQKELNETTNLLWHMGNRLFGCVKDIDNDIKKLGKKLKYHKISYTIKEVAKHTTKGRPKKGTEPSKFGYQVIANISGDESAIASIKSSKGKFILATNQLDTKALLDQDILPTYKAQSGTESGFKFIKDDAFEVSSIFLKKPGRISALLMIMTLCLMVYSYAQYFLRQQLLAHEATIPTQTNKQTNNPSMKWVYRLFHGVCVLKLNLYTNMQNIVLNLNELLRRIIGYFGNIACNIYGITIPGG